MGLPTGRRFDLQSELLGSTPSSSTFFQVEVQMEARLFWEQEDFGSTPRYPTECRLLLRKSNATFAERKATKR